MSFEDRGNALIDVLAELEAVALDYVLVGGYAVSAFETRFSTDLDVVVAPQDKAMFVEFIEERGFELVDRHETQKNWIYDREVEQYEKRLDPTAPIGFDLLVEGLGCRQTGAEWSFDYLRTHSHTREVSGGTRSTPARVVDGALLAAAKLHSGRPGDVADVVAIAADIDLAGITAHLHRGDTDALREQLEGAIELLDEGAIDHRYKSEFGRSVVSEETVDAVREYLTEQVQALS